MTSAPIMRGLAYPRTNDVRCRELTRPFLVFVVVCPFGGASAPPA
jgi:hypothetical protein